MTRRFSNPLSITVPSLLVLVPFDSRSLRLGSASERKERLTRGMHAPRPNAARNLSPVSFRSFEILLPPFFSYARVLATGTRDLLFHVGENKKNFARVTTKGGGAIGEYVSKRRRKRWVCPPCHGRDERDSNLFRLVGR